MNISENTAATTVNGQAPKKPLQNRQISTVCKSLPTATPIEKTENPNEAITSGSRRPFNSENGAQMIGPVANPRTYSDTPSTPTSDDTPNCCATTRVALEKILLPNAATNVVYPNIAAVNNFRLIGQFCACNGSSTPSNSTTYSSLSGSGGGYGLSAPNGGSAFVLFLLLEVRVAPTVPVC